jgi:hypothetical protein
MRRRAADAVLWFADVCATVLALGGVEATPGGSGFPLAIDLHAAFPANQQDGELEARAAFVKRCRRVSVMRTTVTGARADRRGRHDDARPGGMTETGPDVRLSDSRQIHPAGRI